MVEPVADTTHPPDDRWMVFILGLLAPGLGWAYRGFARRGMWLNMLFFAAWICLLSSWVLLKFNPLGPLMWFMVGMGVLTGMSAWDAASATNTSGVRPTTGYLSMMLLVTWLLPVALLVQTTRANVATAVTMRSASMFPALLPGDRILIDRAIYRISRPRLGDIVVYRVPGESFARMGRVVGPPGSFVATVDDAMYVSGHALAHAAIEEPYAEGFRRATGLSPDLVEARFEVLGESVYSIAGVSPSGTTAVTTDREWNVGEDEVFVLNDNRGHIDDSRTFGPIPQHAIVGMPLYVLQSASADPELRAWRRGSMIQMPRTLLTLRADYRRAMEAQTE